MEDFKFIFMNTKMDNFSDDVLTKDGNELLSANLVRRDLVAY